MKKILVLLLAMMMVLSFVACGDEGESSEEEKESNADKGNKVTFEELLVVNNDDCVIKITEVDPDNDWGFTLKAYLENKSADKTYVFSVESAAINGVLCNPFFTSEVAAGKKSNESISFSDSLLEENGIGKFTDIELTFRVYDSNDWAAEPVATETVHVYPYGEDKAVTYVREAQASDKILIDNEYVTVTVIGYAKDTWGYSVICFIQNKSEFNVRLGAEEASVNGYMAEALCSFVVPVGKCAFGSIFWNNTTLEENGITEVEEIEMMLRVHDADDWSRDDFANQTVTLNP